MIHTVMTLTLGYAYKPYLTETNPEKAYPSGAISTLNVFPQ